MPLNKTTLATFTKHRTNVRLTLEIKRAFQEYQVYKIWSSFATSIKSITECFIYKTENSKRKGPERKREEKSRGLCANPGHLLCSDRAMAASVDPSPPRVAPSHEKSQDKEAPSSPSSSSSPLSPSLSASHSLGSFCREEHRTLAPEVAVDCRSSEPSPSNRRHLQLRLVLLYVLAKSCVSGSRRSVVIVEIPRAHRPVFVVNSGRHGPPRSSPSPPSCSR